jgi:hypothetical protein
MPSISSKPPQMSIPFYYILQHKLVTDITHHVVPIDLWFFVSILTEKKRRESDSV